MKLLLTVDDQNYTNDMPVYERFNVRAVIQKDGKLAMERSRLGEYKFPGGGVDQGERLEEALCREVREETGLVVKRDSIQALGEILEMREDLFKKGQKYICHSYFFQCDTEEKMVPTARTESELRQGYELAWVEPERILSGNQTFLYKKWIARDTLFLERWLGNQF